ncbi:MAG: hypothetical protein ACI4PP_01700 [Clostridia bacterium]
MIIKSGEGRTALTYDLTFHGKDLRVHIDGGVSHLGAVTAAFDGKWENTVFPGHKEHFLTEPLAKALASALGCRVVVTAGVHLESITAEEIREIVETNEKTAEKILSSLKKEEIGNED